VYVSVSDSGEERRGTERNGAEPCGHLGQRWRVTADATSTRDTEPTASVTFFLHGLESRRITGARKEGESRRAPRAARTHACVVSEKVPGIVQKKRVCKRGRS